MQDFRASSVNAASVVQERQVLPRFAYHGRDIAALSALGSSVGVFVLDFKHAFMTVPLAPKEMAFNTSVVPETITRTRKALDEQEPTSGQILIWQVLGFGGHANPLVYSRVATFASRSGQALLQRETAVSSLAHGRIQLYVDDPAVVLVGTEQERSDAVDVLVLWWLLLGIPLSWKKGWYGTATEGHTWIGVHFQAKNGVARLRLPVEFIESLRPLAIKFSNPENKLATLKEAQELCGRAGRLGQVIPDARPFINNLYGALAGSLLAQANRSREAPPGQVAIRRYRSAATWLACLLRQEADAPLRLEAKVWAESFSYDPQVQRIEFDASPYGGAAILFVNGQATEYFAIDWQGIEWLGVKTGLSKHQTFWEFLTLALAACRWCPLFTSVLLCGDNVASLNLALSNKSKGLLGYIGRELSWGRAKYD